MRYFNGWSNNYRPQEDGYRTHAFEDTESSGRAICGVQLMEGGGLEIPTEVIPGCRRCQRILFKRGVIKMAGDMIVSALPENGEHDLLGNCSDR